MEKLKVGDKVCNKTVSRWGGGTYYSINSVVKLTATQAVLDNGTRLKNEPFTGYKGEISFRVHGDNHKHYQILTHNLLIEANEAKLVREVEDWFEAKKFTIEEKKEIYLKYK